MDYKLNIELVPDSCWYNNLRTALPPIIWDVVRKDAYVRARGHCMICGARTSRLEAHERWEYDEERGLQTLADVVAICKRCHEVIHIGRTQLVDREREAEEWFMKVNECNYAQYRAALGEANDVHARRNGIAEWQTDISWLNRFIKKNRRSLLYGQGAIFYGMFFLFDFRARFFILI